MIMVRGGMIRKLRKVQLWKAYRTLIRAKIMTKEEARYDYFERFIFEKLLMANLTQAFKGMNDVEVRFVERDA